MNFYTETLIYTSESSSITAAKNSPLLLNFSVKLSWWQTI